MKLRLVEHSSDYREGYGLAVEHANGNYRVKVPDNRAQDFYKGYEVASIRYSGDAGVVTVHRKTVEQLLDLLEGLINEDHRDNDRRNAVNILPHLKRALNRPEYD